MNISVTSAPARTDVHATAPAPEATAGPTRRLAVPLIAGAAAWSAGLLAYGPNPTSDPGIAVVDLTGLMFQAGVLSLVTLQLRTRATGISRKAVAMLKVERVFLVLAMAWSLIHGVAPGARDDLWLAVLDVFWPLSMLGMFVIGVKIAFAGRWRGLARVWPLVAESWVVVTVPAMVIFGEEASRYVGGLHLLVGYATLGLIIALRPHLVVPHKR